MFNIFQMFEDRDLLEMSTRNPGEYARSLLKILFKSEDLQTSLLPSQQSKRYSRPELDNERMKILNGRLTFQL